MLIKLQNTILEMVATGAGLKETIDRLCGEAEAIAPGVCCSVLLVDGRGRIHPLSSPSLPESYSSAFEGLEIGPAMGSCGTAAYWKQEVAVTDIATDPKWVPYRDAALAHGLRACWSSPILSGDGRVIGTFAFYYREPRGPSLIERSIVETCVHLAVIAIEREEQHAERERLIFTDTMTGLPNRAAFGEAIRVVEREEGRQWGLILVDVDNLKITNDTFGHAAGDDLITTVAGRIAGAVQPFKAFRLGGDEFAVLVRDHDGDGLTALAASVLRAIKEPAECAGCHVFPSATLGGAIRYDGDERFDCLRQKADFALYHAKENKRGQFLLYTPDQGTTLAKRFRAVQDVTLALAENRIDAFYQPTVRLDTGEIVGFEALCRMFTATGEVVPAAAFHEATKDARVASELTARMISIVARDVRRWLDMGIPFQHVGINVSSADFHGGQLEERLCRAFGEQRVPLAHVILEVTESVYLSEKDPVVAEEIKALRARGLRVALDDFGTGFASLTHLLSVPVDILKIDKSFVDRLAPDDAGGAIIEGVVGIARKLGIRVLAEGIETVAQARMLMDFGCILGQGFLYSKAVERELATELLLLRGQPRSEGALAPQRLAKAIADPCVAVKRAAS